MNNNKIISELDFSKELEDKKDFKNTIDKINTIKNIQAVLNKFPENTKSKISRPSDHIEELSDFFCLASPPELAYLIKANTFLTGNKFTIYPDSYSNNVKIKSIDGQEFSLTILKIEDAYGHSLMIPILRSENNLILKNNVAFESLTIYQGILEFSKKYGYGEDCTMTTKFKCSEDAFLPLLELKLNKDFTNIKEFAPKVTQHKELELEPKIEPKKLKNKM